MTRHRTLAGPLAALAVAVLLAACSRRHGDALPSIPPRGTRHRPPRPRRTRAARATRRVPDEPARAAGRRRDPDGHAHHRQGRHRDQDRGRPVPDRGRQLRRARGVRLLRQRRVPPPCPGSSSRAATASSDPGRPTRPAPGTGGPRLHDQGRAGDHEVPSRHGGHGPDRASRTASARSSSSSSDDAAEAAARSAQHLPDHRRGHRRHGRRGRDRRDAQRRPGPGNASPSTRRR